MNRFFGAASAVLIASAAFTPAAAQPEVGDAAPAFTLKMFDGSKKTLAAYRGKVLIINYWATWCAPCKSEMPMMSGFHRKHRDRGLEIVGVVTRDSVPEYKLKKVESLLSYPLASDLKGDYGTIGNAVPTSYVIDRKGRVVLARAGTLTAYDFIETILPLLDEPG